MLLINLYSYFLLKEIVKTYYVLDIVGIVSKIGVLISLKASPKILEKPRKKIIFLTSISL